MTLTYRKLSRAHMENPRGDTSNLMMEELKEKLRISEEGRKSLQHKFDVMMQSYRVKEQARYNALKRRYGTFLEEDHRRQQRNENLLHMLERIDLRATNLAARTERLALLRRHYEQYLGRIYPTWRPASHHRIQTPASSVKIRDDHDEDVSGYGTHTGSSGYFRESRRHAEQPRMAPMSTPKQGVSPYKVDILPDKYRLSRVDFDAPSISVIRPTEDDSLLSDHRTQNSGFDLRSESRDLHRPGGRQEFPTMSRRTHPEYSLRGARNEPDFSPRDTKNQAEYSSRGARNESDFSPRDTRNQPEYSLRGARNEPDFSPIDTKNLPEYSLRGARNEPEFSPRDARTQLEYPLRGARNEPDFSPKETRNEPDYSLRGARNEPDFPPVDTRNQPEYYLKGARNEPDFLPKDTRNQPEYPLKGARNEPDFSPKDTRNLSEYSPRERMPRHQTNLAQPEFEMDQNTSGDILNMSLSDDGVPSLSKSDADAELNRRHHWETLKQAYLNRSHQVPGDGERNPTLNDPRVADWTHQRPKPQDAYDARLADSEDQHEQKLRSDEGNPEKESFHNKIHRLKIMVEENKELERLRDATPMDPIEPRDPTWDRNADANTNENGHLDRGPRRTSVFDAQSSLEPQGNENGLSYQDQRVKADDEPNMRNQENIEEPKIRTRRMSVSQPDQHIQKQPSIEEVNSEYQRRKSEQWVEEERLPQPERRRDSTNEKRLVEGTLRPNERRNSVLENQPRVEHQQRQSDYEAEKPDFRQVNEEREYYQGTREDINTQHAPASSQSIQGAEQGHFTNAEANQNLPPDYSGGQYTNEQTGPVYIKEDQQNFATSEQRHLGDERRDSVKQDDGAQVTTANSGPYNYEGREYQNYSSHEDKDAPQISNNNEGERQYYDENAGYDDNRQHQPEPGSYGTADQNYDPQGYDYNQDNTQYGYEQSYPANQTDNSYQQPQQDQGEYRRDQGGYGPSNEQRGYQDNSFYAQEDPNNAGYAPKQEYPGQEYAPQYDNQQQQYIGDSAGWAQQPDQQQTISQQQNVQNDQQGYYEQQNKGEYRHESQPDQQQTISQQQNVQNDQQGYYEQQNKGEYRHESQPDQQQTTSQQQNVQNDQQGYYEQENKGEYRHESQPDQQQTTSQQQNVQNEQHGYYEQQNKGEYRHESQPQHGNEYNYQQQDPNQSYERTAGETPRAGVPPGADEQDKPTTDDTGGYYHDVSEDSTQNSDLPQEKLMAQGQQSPSQRSVDRYRTMLGVDPNSDPSYSEVDELEAEMAAVVAGGTKDDEPKAGEATKPAPKDSSAVQSQNQSKPADTKPAQEHDDSSDFDYSTGP